MRGSAWLAIICFITAPAWGADSAMSRQKARLSFEAGVSLAESGDLEAAIEAFEAAYAAKPHYSVLYNIGQAHLAVGRPAQAMAAFQRYLSEGGEQLTEARQAEVRLLMTALAKRLGVLRLSAPSTAGGRIWLDGTELAPHQLGAPLVVQAGKHTVLHLAPTGASLVREIQVPSGATLDLKLPLPLDPPRPPVAQLVVDCQVPDMTIAVDGTAVARTPLALPLVVTPGRRRVRITRLGYQTQERDVIVSPRTASTLSCDAVPIASLPPDLVATVRVRSTPPNARVLLNGQALAGNPVKMTIPRGRHHLKVERAGYEPISRIVTIRGSDDLTLDIALEPNAATLERQRDRRSLAYILSGTGAAALATAASLFVWNQARFDDWKGRPRAISDTSEATSIQRIDDLALGLTLAGGAAAGAASWLFFPD